VVAADLGYAALIGLGAMKLTQIYKEIVGRWGLHQLAWWKSAVNLVICLGLVFLISTSAANRILIALAAAGISALLHALDTVLRSRRDELVANVLTRTRVQRR
jgi:hypothetical protein